MPVLPPLLLWLVTFTPFLEQYCSRGERVASRVVSTTMFSVLAFFGGVSIAVQEQVSCGTMDAGDSR